MQVYFLFFLLFFSFHAHSQTELIDKNVFTEESPEDGQLYNAEEMVQVKTKINLNKANAIELLSTGLLNKKQIQEILYHRQAFGNFISIYELQCVDTFSKDTLSLLAETLYVPDAIGNHHSLNALLDEGSHYSLTRWSRKTRLSKGFQSNSKGNKLYLGSDYNLRCHVRSSFPNVYQLGLSMEKDAGEPLNWSPASHRYAFDYLSGYLLLYPKKIIQQIAWGDFHFRSGHGLVFGGNFFQSKNPEYWQGTWQMGTGFRPHSSSAEYGFFRGTGIKWQYQNWEGNWFYSYTSQDATLKTDQSISAINTNGLHRTQTEINGKHNTHLKNTGGNMGYTSPNKQWKAGAEYLYTHFDYPYIPSDVYYHKNNFSGQTHHIIGLFAQYLYSSGMIFTETAFSSQHGKAIYGGLIHNLSRQNIFILQYWSANTSFQSFQGNIPSYSSNIANETGIYQAFLISLSSHTRISVGWSAFTNPKPAYNRRGPTYGNEWIGRVTYQLKKKTTAFIQLRWKGNEENYKTGNNQYSQLLPLIRYYITTDLYHKENL
ncbi:MAG TPA: helix-hairpin-helix domain-containing protein, partial [Cytophagaceae bacterium]|nr:helix-hairpin-helix domain-containing protein [Cytophagaceae bacterium]